MTTTELVKDAKGDAVRLKKILVPTDFSESSLKALQYALRFGREFGGEITLLHAVEAMPGPSFPELPCDLGCEQDQRKYAEEQFREIKAAAGNRDAMTGTVRFGAAAYEILREAAESDVDLIVMGTHGHTGWKHFVLGSTAECVVRSAPCPVLVVREKEHDFI